MKKHQKNGSVTPRTPKQTEWLTLIVIGANYVAFAALTLFYEQLPWWLLIPLAGYSLALYSSLQHEVLHGHPTPWQWLNEALVFPALTLWLPYPLYKQSHLRHHNKEDLTDPERDPESFYLSPERWSQMSGWQQGFFHLLNTLLGRVVLGPFYVVLCTWRQEFYAIRAGHPDKLSMWAVHAVAMALVLYWVTVICGISVWAYLLFFVYPGIALTLVRSFLEHQAVADSAHRSVIVEAGPLFSLLFLNNNLHAIHHDKPGLAWYRLPAIWRQQRNAVLQRNGHYYYAGYWAVFRQYAWRCKELPYFPLGGHTGPAI